MGKVLSIMPWRDLSLTGSESGWDSLNRLQRDVDTIFDRLLQGSPVAGAGRASQGALFAPKLDIAETENAFHLTAELPGVTEQDIDLQVNEGVLTIKGEKKSEEKQGGKNFHRIERSYGAFQRSVALPSDIDEENISAQFRNGVLEIALPKAKEPKAKSRKIGIKSA